MLNFWVALQAFDKPFSFPAFGPKIEAVDVTVGEPEGSVMRVVMLFAFGLFHGISAGEAFAVRANHWVIEDVRCGSEVVRGEEFSIDGHDNPIRLGFDLHIGVGGESKAGGRKNRESDSASEGGDERTHRHIVRTERAIESRAQDS